MDEIERCLLQKICNLGRDMTHSVAGIWFVDLNLCRQMGRLRTEF